MGPRLTPLLALLRRTFAAGMAGLVFVLGLFAASPVLHHQLHHGSDLTSLDDGCVIAHFASGVSVPAPVSAPPPPLADFSRDPQATSSEICLNSPRYLLQPERGPPAV
jgi:hypothetical protein